MGLELMKSVGTQKAAQPGIKQSEYRLKNQVLLPDTRT